MARKIVWSYEATADLKTLAEYINSDSPSYAASFVHEIRDASRSLREFSKRGRIVPEFEHTNIRELFVREYRLIYYIEKSRVVILGLIHGQRDLKSLWEKERTGR